MERVKINYDVELNDRCQNKNIKARILSKEKMREIGFTDNYKGNWVYSKIVETELDIRFYVFIDKNTEVIKIDILHEDYCQPFDYQAMLRTDPNNHNLERIHIRVQEEMMKLIEAGVVKGYVQGDYI